MTRYEELQQMIRQNTNECILWRGFCLDTGYGQVFVDGATRYAHRISWQLANGLPIPDGMEIDHLCMVKSCVNPRHLEAVAPRTNIRRADAHYKWRSALQHCPRGHEFNLENTYWHDGSRHCRTCRRGHKAEQRRRERQRRAEVRT